VVVAVVIVVVVVVVVVVVFVVTVDTMLIQCEKYKVSVIANNVSYTA